MQDPRYPIGELVYPSPVTHADVLAAIDQIAACPAALRAAVRGLDDRQLDTAYREGGWTIRQVSHHLPDSHMNAYVRMKLALTEDNPTVKPYEEALWAQTEDSVRGPVEVSVRLLEALHERWVHFMRSLPESAWKRTLIHPENGPMVMEQIAVLYGYHGRHHVAQITSLCERKGW